MVSVRSGKPICAPPVSQKSPQRCLSNSFNACVTDDGPLSAFQGRSSSVSSPCLSLPGDRWYDVLWVVPASCVSSSSTLQIYREEKPLVMIAFPSLYLLGHLAFTPSCLGKYTHSNFRRWMLTIDTFQCGLHIPLCTFYSKLIESMGSSKVVVCGHCLVTDFTPPTVPPPPFPPQHTPWVSTHTHTHTHTYTHTHTPVCTHPRTRAHTHTHARTHARTHAHTRMHARAHTRHTHTYARAHACTLHTPRTDRVHTPHTHLREQIHLADTTAPVQHQCQCLLTY